MNDELRRQLEVAEAEDAFVQAKAKGRDSKDYQKAKERLAEVRGAYRLARDTRLSDGDAVAEPDTLTTKVR